LKVNIVRPFTDRENFIVASVIMVVSDKMKSVSRETRTNILQYIRETKYPGVTDQDWKDIANGIDATIKFSLSVNGLTILTFKKRLYIKLKYFLCLKCIL